MTENFKTRFGLIASLLGMAIGTGNIWRFPRVMAANGGGAFLIPWLLFLFLWSIPLLIVEFSLGQKLRRGVVGCFKELTGGKYSFLGAYVVFCTLGIMFYYSVVSGWCLYYALQAGSGSLMSADPKPFWDGFNTSGIFPLIFHGVSIGLVLFVILRGVQKGIEAVNKIVLPSIFLVFIFLAGYSMTLPGREQGLGFIFNADLSRLSDYKVWLEALTQSAWSTGAGWGVALSYACYSRSQDNAVKTPFVTGFGNNTLEFLVALAILPTLFSFFPLQEVLELTKSGNTGLTFIALPGLFQKMPFGYAISVFFFTALFMAAFSSLISMVEIGVQFFADMGMARKKAIFLVVGVGFLIGVPSALNPKFLDNQDWVWGVGLLLSGFFFALLMRHVGMEKFCRDFVPLKSKFHRGVFEFLVFWLIPLEFLALLGWWFYQAMTWDPSGWWNPLNSLSIGTCLVQWGVLLAVLFALNKWMSERIDCTHV